MNILLTSAGRRGYLVEYFKEALKTEGEVHVGNSTAQSPAFYYADKNVITPMIYDKDYIPFILRYCIKNKIETVISLFDVDLFILAQNKELFKANGINVIVSDIGVVEMCNDKWKTYEFCIKNNINTPKTYKSIEKLKDDISDRKINFPIIIKPRWGMGSIGIFEAMSIEELEILSRVVKRKIFNSYLQYEAEIDKEQCIIYQEKINGKEFGLDIINDLHSKCRKIIVREKYAMRSGETDCAVVRKNLLLEQLGEDIGKQTKHIGNMDVDILLSGKDIYVIEFNARFGGGYPFSYESGVNLPKALIKWVQNKEISDELDVDRYNRVLQKDIRLIDITEFYKEIL